jgi:hypothetical protein
LSGLLAVGNTLFGETGFGGNPGCSFAGHPGCGTVFALVAVNAPPRGPTSADVAQRQNNGEAQETRNGL